MAFNVNDIDWKEFKNPPKSARPMVRWWWTGMDVEEDELLREVRELDEAGFLGAEIQVFMIGSPWRLEKKDKKRAERAHRFMQPYYYEMIKSVLDEASKRNMKFDLTIGSAWPAGGVHIDKENSMKVLLIGQKVVNGPKHFSRKVPKFKKPFFYTLTRLAKILVGYNIMQYFKKDMKLTAVVAAKPLGKPGKIKFRKVKTSYIDKDSITDITDKVNDKGKLEWDVPEGKWQIFTFYKGPSGARPLLDCRSTKDKFSLVLDHLSAQAIKYHLDLHLGEAKNYFGQHFGKTLRAFFTDSLELSSDWTWTEDFLDQFKQRRGYDLRPFLPVCFVVNRDNKYFQALVGGDIPAFDIKGDIGERIRYDYELTLSDIFSEEFVREMTKWANENNLLSRIQAYGIRADTLKSYGIAHIPETEQLYAGGMIDFLKLAGSAGLIYEKPIVTAESIVWNRRDYMTTPLKWKVAADRLFISGINQMIYHGFPYQNPLFPYPGFCGFSTPYLPRAMNFSSNFSRMNPFWNFFPKMNEYITRCQYILQHGITISNIAIFFPSFNYNDSVLKKEELIGGCLDENDAPTAKGQIGGRKKREEKLDANDRWNISLLELTDLITAHGYFYSHVNEESIINSSSNDNKLNIGSARFDMLIIPNVKEITLNLAKKIEEGVNTGLSIIFLNKLPIKQPGYLNFEENDEEIKTIIETLYQSKKIHFIENLESLINLLQDDLNIQPGIEYNEPQPSIYYIHKKTENSNYYFIRHSNNIPKEICIKFPHPNKVPFILDPWTGKIEQAIRYREEKEAIEMNLYFESYGSYIIEFKADEPQKHSFDAPEKSEREKDGITGYIEEETLPPINLKEWHLKTNLRDYKGILMPIDMDLKELRDWREINELQYCSSNGIYTTTFNLTKEYLQDNFAMYLSLGRVNDVAIVRINGNECPPLLLYPYELNITSLVQEGENQIEVEITPTLRNRLIGYGKKGGKKWKNHKKKKVNMPSGLIGPVIINPFKKVKI